MSHPADAFLTDSRRRLIEAATEAFMAEGYRASVDRIAARAGVAKQTLYNHFPCKGELFSEVAHIAATSILVTLDNKNGDVRECLLRFSLALTEKVLGDEGLAFFRTLVAEAGRFPDLAQAFYAKGPEQTVSRLAAYLEGTMAAGLLRRDDPRFAAEMLVGMLVGFERTRRLCGVAPLSPEAGRDRVERMVDGFLRAYAPEERTTK